MCTRMHACARVCVLLLWGGEGGASGGGDRYFFSLFSLTNCFNHSGFVSLAAYTILFSIYISGSFDLGMAQNGQTKPNSNI